MIEIKVSTKEHNDGKAEICVVSRAKHSGPYGVFLKEMITVFSVLEKIDGEVFRDALNDYLLNRVIDTLKESDESEGDDE